MTPFILQKKPFMRSADMVLTMKLLCSALIISGTPIIVRAAGTPGLNLTLSDTENGALYSSARLKAAELELDAIVSRADSQRSLILPRVSFDAYYRYVTRVPELTLPVPGAVPRQLSDNKSYSAGPAISWTAWDRNSGGKSWLSARELSKSKLEEIKAIKLRLLLSARAAYFQVQLALEQVRLLGDSLKLAQAQYEDIKEGYDAGTKSRIDMLSAHQEALTRKKQFLQARTESAAALRDLFALTGLGNGINAAFPLDDTTAAAPPRGTEPPTIRLTLDRIEKSMSALEPVLKSGPDMAHPGLETLSRLAQSLKLLSESLSAGLYPKIQLSARTGIDYPNGPDFAAFNQNAFGVTASFPLFEAGKSRSLAREQGKQAEAAEKKMEQFKTELLRDWDKAMDQVSSLKLQRGINAEISAETEELSRLIYSSYAAGRSTFLEVQNSNLRALEAKVQSVRTDIQILIQLAILTDIAK